MRYILLCVFCLFTLSGLGQGDDKIILRYWNGTTDGKGVTHPMGLKVTATNYPIVDAIERVNEASLSGQPQNFYLKKKFQLFFRVENTGPNDVAIYDWAFSAICPVDNMGRPFDANSMVPLITPYIPGDIYLVLKPGDKKMFFSGVTDFYWCLPGDKKDLLIDPKYFQARMTCAAIYGSGASNTAGSKTTPASGNGIGSAGKKKGDFSPSFSPPQKAGSGLDPQFEKLIDEHNTYIDKNDNKAAEALKKRILEFAKILYPGQLPLIESKLLKPKVPAKVPANSGTLPPSPIAGKSTLTFNSRAIEAEGECMGATATLIGTDESDLLVLNNLGDSGNFTVNSNFYTEACSDCLAVQFQDINNAKTYIAVSGTIKRTAKEITIDITMKDMVSLIEGGSGSYRVTGRIVCE